MSNHSEQIRICSPNMFCIIPNGSILLRGELFVIKLQDFAKECGVTDRAIQKHLVKYADELNGLYERKGPNGTWLSDAACDILRSKMKQQPIVVSDGSLARQAEKLKSEEQEIKEEEAENTAQEEATTETKITAEGKKVTVEGKVTIEAKSNEEEQTTESK